MAVRARLGVSLAEIASCIKGHNMINSTTQGAVIMAVKISCMANITGAAAGNSRRNEVAIGHAVAACTSTCSMDSVDQVELIMAADTISRNRRRGSVCQYYCCMVMGVAVEIGSVALAAIASAAAIHCCIAIAIDSDYPAAVCG